MSQPIAISNRTPLSAASFSKVDTSGVRQHVAQIADTLKEPRRIVIAGRLFDVDYAMLAAAVNEVLDVLATGTDVSVGQLRGTSPFLRLVTDKDAVRAQPLHPSYQALLDHGPLQWPEKDVLPGIIVALGDTGSGKTTYLLKDSGVDVIIRYGEPYEAVDRAPNTVPALSVVEAISMAFLLSALGWRVAIDSLRTLVYGLEGNAMEGGMVASLFDLLTQLNNLAAEAGFVIHVAINPMLADMSKADRLFKRVAASVSGAVHIVDGSVRERTFRLASGRSWGQVERPDNEVGFVGPANPGPNVSKLGDAVIRDSVAAAYNSPFDYDEADSPRPVATFNL